MRTPFIAILLLAAAPAFAQPAPPAQPQLGARTRSPDQMVGAISQVSPEEEMRQLVAAAAAHPLGTIENPVRVGGPEGEHAYLGRPPLPGRAGAPDRRAACGGRRRLRLAGLGLRAGLRHADRPGRLRHVS
jgi:hypothetical protein